MRKFTPNGLCFLLTLRGWFLKFPDWHFVMYLLLIPTRAGRWNAHICLAVTCTSILVNSLYCPHFIFLLHRSDQSGFAELMYAVHNKNYHHTATTTWPLRFWRQASVTLGAAKWSRQISNGQSKTTALEGSPSRMIERGPWLTPTKTTSDKQNN